MPKLVHYSGSKKAAIESRLAIESGGCGERWEMVCKGEEEKLRRLRSGEVGSAWHVI